MKKQTRQSGAKDAEREVDVNAGLKSKTIRLDVEAIVQLQALADARGMSFSALLRAAGEMYLAREMFSVGLADMEERMGSTLKAVMRENHRIADDQQLTPAFVDQLARFLLHSTSEVVDKAGAVALGNRRYKGFIAEFHKSYNNRTDQFHIAQNLEEATPED